MRLYEPGQRLAVAEGIETALSIRAAWPDVPVWSCINAGGLASLVVPDHIQEVSIYADNDQNGKGQEAGQTLPQRLTAEGRKVSLYVPETHGNDFNDELLRE